MPTRYETCEIRWHIEKGNYLLLRPDRVAFVARAIGPGGEYPAAYSPAVPKWQWSPSRRDPALDSAHQTLIATLSAAGWEPTGRGAAWWQDQFRRALPHP